LINRPSQVPLHTAIEIQIFVIDMAKRDTYTELSYIEN
jgi:hypothetical protein